MIVILYTIGGVMSYPFFYALNFAYFQRRYYEIAAICYRSDKTFALIHSILGALYWPICWPLVYFMFARFKYGMKWK